VRYGKLNQNPKSMFALTISEMAIHGFATLFLTWALNSTLNKLEKGTKISKVEEEEDDGSVPKVTLPKKSFSQKCLECIFSIELLSILLFLLFSMITALRAVFAGTVLMWFQFSVILLQRLPIFYLYIHIICSIRYSRIIGVGKLLISKFLLTFAIFLTIPNELNMGFYYQLITTINASFGTSCNFYLLTIYDLFMLVSSFSLIFLILFITCYCKINNYFMKFIRREASPFRYSRGS